SPGRSRARRTYVFETWPRESAPRRRFPQPQLIERNPEPPPVTHTRLCCGVEGWGQDAQLIAPGASGDEPGKAWRRGPILAYPINRSSLQHSEHRGDLHRIIARE